MLASFAMAFDVDIHTLLEELGHDGSKIVFPDLKEPECRASFHPQEFVIVGMKMGKKVICIEKEPLIGIDFNHVRSVGTFNLFDFITYPGNYVLVRTGHAIACDGKNFYDPSGKVSPLQFSSYFNYLFIVK